METNIVFENTNYNLYNIESTFDELVDGRVVPMLKIAFSIFPESQKNMDMIFNRCLKENPTVDIPQIFSNSERTKVQIVVTSENWYIALSNYYYEYQPVAHLNEHEKENFIEYVNKWLKEHNFRFYFNNIIEFSEIWFKQFLDHNISVDIIDTIKEMARLYYSRY